MASISPVKLCQVPLNRTDYRHEARQRIIDKPLWWEVFVSLAIGLTSWLVKCYTAGKWMRPELYEVMAGVGVFVVLLLSRRVWHWTQIGYDLYWEQAVRVEQLETAANERHQITDILNILFRLRHEAIYTLLNVVEPPVHEQQSVALVSIPQLQAWDSRVDRELTEAGCEPYLMMGIRNIRVPVEPLTKKFSHEMNMQWSISVLRLEEIERLIEVYLKVPVYDGLPKPRARF